MQTQFSLISELLLRARSHVEQPTKEDTNQVFRLLQAIAQHQLKLRSLQRDKAQRTS